LTTTEFPSPGDRFFYSAITNAPSGNLAVVQRNVHCLDLINCNLSAGELEYRLFSPSGDALISSVKLTDLGAVTLSTYDNDPSVAVAPDGTVGVVWNRRIYASGVYQWNENVYFATFDASGTLLSGPVNLTNNDTWGTDYDADFYRFYAPVITATDDNRFVMGWQKVVNNTSNFFYAGYDTAGTNIFSPKILTTNVGVGIEKPILNSLSGGKVILTWIAAYLPGSPVYAVLNSDGSIFQPEVLLNVDSIYYGTVDAVLLPNGKVAIAWQTNAGVQFAILSSSYALESISTQGDSPWGPGNDLSVTTDADSHVIMVWPDEFTEQHFQYALGDSAGSFVTLPMVFATSSYPVYANSRGQGIAPYTLPVTTHIYLPLIVR